MVSTESPVINKHNKPGPRNWIFNGPHGEEKVKVEGSIQSDSIQFLMEAMERGAGIGIQASFDYTKGCDEGSLKTLFHDYDPMCLTIYGLYPSKDFLPLKTSAFLDFLKGWLRENLSG